MLAPGSEMWLQGSIGDGALDYTGVSGITTRRIGFSAANAYVDGANSIRTTKSWTISGGLRHNWTPTIQSNFHGAFGRVDVPAFCPSGRYPRRRLPPTNNSFSWYSLEKNIIWRPVSGLQLGAEVQYGTMSPVRSVTPLRRVRPSRPMAFGLAVCASSVTSDRLPSV